MLGADLDEEIARRFLPSIEVTRIEAARRGGYFVQIADRPVSKGMLAYAGPNDAERRRAANRRADLRALIEVEAARAGPGGVLAVSYQAAEAAIRKQGDIASAEMAHFNAIRGRDTWKAVDTLIATGRPEPMPVDNERTTRALFWKEPRPIRRLAPGEDGRVRYETRVRGGWARGSDPADFSARCRGRIAGVCLCGGLRRARLGQRQQPFRP